MTPPSKVYPSTYARVEAICEFCHSPFQCLKKASTCKKRQRFCSLKCAGKAHHPKLRIETIKCVFCGKEFTFNNTHANRPNRKFCSQSCMGKYKSEKSRMDTKRKRICKQCGKEFLSYPSQIGRFCSQKCVGDFNRKLKPQICPCCGREFQPYNHRKRRFCSQECQHKFNVGKNNPLWRGNRRQERGPNWKSQAEAARLRDGYLCQGCGSACSQKASVDHIVPFRLTKLYAELEGKDANDLQNLISLCRSCHAKKTMAERKLLRGDVMGFLADVRVFMPIERVESALVFWGLR